MSLCRDQRETTSLISRSGLLTRSSTPSLAQGFPKLQNLELEVLRPNIIIVHLAHIKVLLTWRKARGATYLSAFWSAEPVPASECPW